MWSSIKSDLLEFVSIVTEDTTKTLSKVIGDENDDNENEDTSHIRDKMVCDLRRSYNSYTLPIEDQYMKEYDKYLKKFQLSSYATEITSILDAEIDVSRYYAELVPTNITPEEFWSRYFFRIVLLMRGGVVNLDEEYDDEDLAWEGDDAVNNNNETHNTSPMTAAKNDLLEANQSLSDENRLLKSQIKMLCSRISELENQLVTAAIVDKSIYSNSTLIVNPTSSSAVAAAAPSEVSAVDEKGEDGGLGEVADSSTRTALPAAPTAVAELPRHCSSDLMSDGSEEGLVIVESAAVPAPTTKKKALPSLDDDEGGWD